MKTLRCVLLALAFLFGCWLVASGETNTESNRTAVVLTGSGQTIPLGWPFFDATDLVVRKAAVGATSTTALAYGVDYSVSGGAGDDGSITLTAGSAGERVYITRSTPVLPVLRLSEGDDLPAKALENALEKLRLMVADAKGQIGRVIRLTATSETADEVEILAGSGTSKLLGFDGTGKLGALDTASLVALLNLPESVVDLPLKTFADAGGRAAAVPDYVGQVGVQLDLKSTPLEGGLWVATGTSAGNWAAVAVSAAAIPSGSISTAKLADGAVATAKIEDLAITTGKLAALGVTGEKLASASVTADKLGTGAVTSTILGTASVTSSKLGTGSVLEGALGQGAVTEAKLAGAAVTEAKLGAGAVTSAKLGSGAVLEAALGTGAVTEGKIGNGAVTTAKLGDLAVTDAKLAADAVTTAKILDSAVTTAKLANNSVTSDKLSTTVLWQPMAAFFRVEERATSSANFSNSGWQKRLLGTKAYDPRGLVTLSSNEVTLPAGSYVIRAGAQGNQVGTHEARLYDVTHGVELAYGTAARSAATTGDPSWSWVIYQGTFAVDVTIRLEHRCGTSYGSGIGLIIGYNTYEVFSWLEGYRLEQ